VRGLLVINPRSGNGSAEDLRQSALSRGVLVHVLREGDDAAAIARDADVDAVGVAGGDGSLARVAAVALERDVPFVCVPFGTRNHFARDLGLDRDDAERALDAFRDGVERRIDVAYANDRLFLNNVSLGAYAMLVHRRERHRRRRNAFARLRAFAILATNRDPIGLTIDGAPISARVVLVSNNGYALDMLSIGERARLDEGALHLYAPQGWFRSSWEERAATRFSIDARRHRLRAAVDGEPDVLETPIEFRVEPRALRVLLPRDEEENMSENPPPTETEEELAQTERQEEEEDMRGTTDPETQES
jgi:diacylglycerol kinase family enzyme